MFTNRHDMIPLRDFFSFQKNRRFWLNMIAIFIVLILLLWGSYIGLGIYTRHGEERTVPAIQNKTLAEAQAILEEADLEGLVIDSVYSPNLPLGTILSLSPEAGARVKPGRTIYLTVSSTNIPLIKIPDLIDNSSLRQAEAKLRSLGFKLTPPQYIVGEQDWVYGIKLGDRYLNNGDKAPREAMLTVVAGNSSLQDSLAIDTLYRNMLSEETDTIANNKKKTPPRKEDDWF